MTTSTFGSARGKGVFLAALFALAPFASAGCGSGAAGDDDDGGAECDEEHVCGSNCCTDDEYCYAGSSCLEVSGECEDGACPEDARCIESTGVIHYRPYREREEIKKQDWLPPGPVRIGLTAGASTPNNKIGEVIESIASLRGLQIP